MAFWDEMREPRVDLTSALVRMCSWLTYFLAASASARSMLGAFHDAGALSVFQIKMLKVLQHNFKVPQLLLDH